MSPSEHPQQKWCRTTVITLCSIVLFISCLNILSWLFPLEQTLQKLFPAWMSMQKVSTFCMILTTISLLFPKISKITSTFVLFTSLFVLLEYITNTGMIHYQMRLMTSINFILLSTAILLLDDGYASKTWIMQTCVILVFLNALFSLLSYMFEADPHYALVYHTRIGLHTSISFFLLGTAVILSKPHRGILRILLSDSQSGMFLRRIPLLILLFWIAGALLGNYGARMGLYDNAYGDVISIMSSLIILVVLIVLNVNELTREERKRYAAERALTSTKEKFKQISAQDKLTGLMNRDALEPKLEQLIKEDVNAAKAVIVFDVDKFKLINEVLGYDAGDTLLQEIAERFAHQNFPPDTILAKLIADKYVLVINHAENTNQVINYVYQIFLIFKEPFYIKEKELCFTPSIGISSYPKHGEHASELLKNADIALSRAKREGGNKFQIYTNKLPETMIDRLTIENEIRSAIANNEFVLYFQPKIDLKSGLIVGLESLIRWQHPQKGLLQPGYFMGVAEESGLVIPLSEWIMREIFSLIVDHEFNVPIAVNLSVQHFKKQYNLVGYLQQMLKGFHVDAKQVELEITETVLMTDADYSLSVLADLKAMGFHLTLDDFGTGYSSLNYLKNISADKIKLDKSFADSIPHNKDTVTIVRAVIALFHALKKKVIAEGIETKEQCEFLVNEGCDEIQGYYFSEPLSFEQIKKLLDEKKRWKIPNLDSVLT